MSANDRQVGGTHYKTAYEHWDLVLAVGLGYMEGQATGYVARWRRKNGLEDLSKALHYVEKLIECRARAAQILRRASHGVALEEIWKFSVANDLSSLERVFMERLAVWRTLGDLETARELLLQIMAEATPEPAPVPLAEENHYSERALIGGPDGNPPQD